MLLRVSLILLIPYLYHIRSNICDRMLIKRISVLISCQYYSREKSTVTAVNFCMNLDWKESLENPIAEL